MKYDTTYFIKGFVKSTLDIIKVNLNNSKLFDSILKEYMAPNEESKTQEVKLEFDHKIKQDENKSE